MTGVTIVYNTETGRIVHEYWGNANITPTTNSDEQVTSISTSKDVRNQIIDNALSKAESNVDYDPNSETIVAELYYDADDEALYAEAEVQSIQK